MDGDVNDVLKLAHKLVNQSGLRQGSLSKAARGYHRRPEMRHVY